MVFPHGMTFTQVGVEAATGRVWGLASSQNDIRYFTYDGSTWKEDVALRGLGLNRFANGPKGEFIFCSRDTLLLHKNNTWIAIPEPEEGKYNYVEHPVFDPQGRLWVMAKLRKMYRYDDLGTLPKLVTSAPGINVSVHDMAFDPAGNLYTATYDFGLGKWNGTNWTYLPSLSGTSKKVFMWRLNTDPLGRLWITQALYYTTYTLTLWADGKPQKNLYYGIPQASQMVRDGEGNLWFGGSAPLMARQNLADGSLDYFEMFDFFEDQALFASRFDESKSFPQAAQSLGWSEIRVRKQDTALRTRLLATLRQHGFLQKAKVSIGQSLLVRRDKQKP